MERSAPCILPDDSIEAFLRLDSQHSTIIIRQLFLPPQKGWNFFVQFVDLSSSRKYFTWNCKYPRKETFRLVSSYFNSINSHPRSQAGRMLWPPGHLLFSSNHLTEVIMPPPPPPPASGSRSPRWPPDAWGGLPHLCSSLPSLHHHLRLVAMYLHPPGASSLLIWTLPPSLPPTYPFIHLLHTPQSIQGYPTIKPGLPQIEDTYPFPGTKTFSLISFQNIPVYVHRNCLYKALCVLIVKSGSPTSRSKWVGEIALPRFILSLRWTDKFLTICQSKQKTN